MFLHLTTKECSCMFIATNWLQIRKNIGQTITYNKAASLESSYFDGTHHSEWQNGTVSVVQLASLAGYIAKPPFGEVLMQSFLPSDNVQRLTLCFSTLHECTLISHVQLTPGWALIQVNFDPIQEIGLKGGVGVLLRVGVLLSMGTLSRVGTFALSNS